MNFDTLKLENQLCFPLYAASREVIKVYKPFLDGLDLTYTQYIAMILLWEHNTLTVKEMGDYLFLDSGTLTPLLKKLEQKVFYKHSGYVGGIKEIPYKRIMANKPEFAVKEAIRGMLPHNALGRAMFSKLRVYAGTEHNHQAQKPELLELHY